MATMFREIENVMKGTIPATYAIHDLLNRVIELYISSFFANETATVDIRLLENECTFVTSINGYDIHIHRNLNTFSIDVKIARRDQLVGEASININGAFAERYFGKWNKDEKIKFVDWFTEISNIDVTDLLTGDEPEEAEQVKPEVVESHSGDMSTSDMADCEHLSYLIDRDTEPLDDDSPVIYDDDDDED